MDSGFVLLLRANSDAHLKLSMVPAQFLEDWVNLSSCRQQTWWWCWYLVHVQEGNSSRSREGAMQKVP